MKILAVDDDEFALDLLKASLCVANYTDVTVASSAYEALEILDNSPDAFDCLMLDIMMPDVDGIELCQTIRDSKQHANIPIIMITALSEQCHIDRAFEAGATDYVTKPFEGQELAGRINAASALSTMVSTEREAKQAANSLKEKLDKFYSVEVSQRFDIEGVPGAADVFELENHLLKMPAGKSTHEMFAFKIIEVENLHGQLSPTDFRLAINNVAGCISDCISSSKLKIAYAGDGAFVCVSTWPSTHRPAYIEANVKEAVNGLGITNADGQPISIDIIMGRPTKANLWSDKDAVASLENVIKDVELNCSDRQTQSKLDSFKPKRPRAARPDSIQEMDVDPTVRSYEPLIRGDQIFSKLKQRRGNVERPV